VAGGIEADVGRLLAEDPPEQRAIELAAARPDA
jgi:hypothetical protein